MTFKFPAIDIADRDDGKVIAWDDGDQIHKYVEVLAGVPPGTELDYTEFTSGVSVTATSEATANTVVTAGAIALDGSTPIVIEFFSPAVRPHLASAAQILIVLYLGSASIGRLAFMRINSGSNGEDVPMHCVRRLTPTNGTHTFSIRAWVSTGTGTVGAGAGGDGVLFPGFIRITTA